MVVRLFVKDNLILFKPNNFIEKNQVDLQKFNFALLP